MGKGSTDGEISFTGLNLTDSAILAFRASPYNSANSMQLDVYADDSLLQSIQVTVTMETRHEVRYRLSLPAGTQTIRLVSVGGSTSKRACMQELYLLSPKKDHTALVLPEPNDPVVRKEIQNGQMVIIKNNHVYTPLGQQKR